MHGADSVVRAMLIRLLRPDDHGAVGELTVEAYAAVEPATVETGYDDELRDVAARSAGVDILVAVDDGPDDEARAGERRRGPDPRGGDLRARPRLAGRRVHRPGRRGHPHAGRGGRRPADAASARR